MKSNFFRPPRTSSIFAKSAKVMSVAFACALVAPMAHADYPDRPITIIVPWAACGGTDAVARSFGAALQEELGTDLLP